MQLISSIYDSLYHSFLICVEQIENAECPFPFVYEAKAVHPQSGERYQVVGITDTEALHKLRGKIDDEYGKPRLPGN